MSSTQVAYFERAHDGAGYIITGPYLAGVVEVREHVADLLVDTGSGPRLIEDVHHLLAPLQPASHPTFSRCHWRGVRSGDGLGHSSTDVLIDPASVEHAV